ncbi:THUMP domain-containing protein 2-like [Gavia stellata]|uniref:THUMP domain-containing protein 2-like n=1 Tax=Gavia stellata TaxID=37040 RepID=UPI00289BDB6F|nr:THUMP domain-containing protein 2-like [Gavia stellata]
MSLKLDGKMLHEMKSLVLAEPKCWLDVISVWRKLHGREGKKDNVSQENPLLLKSKSEEETNIASDRQKPKQVRETVSEQRQAEAGERVTAVVLSPAKITTLTTSGLLE